MNSIDASNTGSAITSIKTEVAQAIQGSDSAVEIRATDYFNNTYAPDLVLTWPKAKVTRHVYIRTSSNVEYLTEDVDLLGEVSSIVMPLRELPERTEQRSDNEELHAASRRRKALVTGPASFRSLGEKQEHEPVVALASRSLLQGGSGVVRSEAASEFGESLSLGFDAAKQADPDHTAHAVQVAEHLLDPARAAEVNSFLHAVWVGSGGDGTAFPGASGVTASPSGAALDILLRTVEIADGDFWRRVGRTLTFAKLAEVRASVDDNNFQYLIRANADRLKAKAVRLVAGPPSTHEEARWFVQEGEVGLRFKNWTATFAGQRLNDFRFPGITSEATVSALKQRATRAGIKLSEVTVGTEDRRLDYAAEDGAAITDDEQLDKLQEAMGSRALVKNATAVLGTRELRSDFASSTANGRTASMFYVSDFIKYAIPLFRELGRSDLEELLETAIGDTSTSEDDA